MGNVIEERGDLAIFKPDSGVMGSGANAGDEAEEVARAQTAGGFGAGLRRGLRLEGKGARKGLSQLPRRHCHVCTWARSLANMPARGWRWK